MGSLFSGKQKTSTTQNQSWGPVGYIGDAYKNLVGQAQQTAQTPWNPATRQQVAGFNPTQHSGFTAVRQTVGDYKPYLADAGALADRGSAAITGADISRYMNPYTDQVIGAAMNDWDLMSDRRMADVNSNAAKVGALTGDRSQVAQALAREASDREMSSGIANLRNQGWQSALGAAQTDASRALQGSQIQSGLGQLAQQLGFNDANALLGIGGMQQDQRQKVLDAKTGNVKAQSAYPFETQQWLASLLQGIGSQAGGTSEGTGTSTSKSSGGLLGKVLGLGAMAFGAPGMANGGVVEEPANVSYVPLSNLRPTASASPPQMAMPSAPQGASGGMGDMLESLKMAKDALNNSQGGLAGLTRKTTDPVTGWATQVNPSGAEGWGNYISNGLGGLASGIGSVFGFADGGVVDKPTAAAAPPAEKGWGSMWGNGLSDDANQAIFMAGLGMLGGGGRDAFEDIGRGGLAGMNFYNQAQRQRKADAEAKAKEAEGKLMEVGGRVIRMLPDGTTSVVYEAPVAPKKTDDIVEYEYAKQNGFTGDFNQFMTSKGGANPITYGKTVLFTEDNRAYVTGEDGSVRFLEFPEGSKPLGPGELASERARGSATGKAVGEAKAALPGVLQTAGETVKLIDSLMGSKGLDSIVGTIDSRTPNIFPAATEAQARFDQIKGRAFLEGFKSLRGGGQITEKEGEAARQAIARLDQAQDEKAIRAALQDLRDVARNGVIRAQVDAGVLSQDELNQLRDFDGVADLVATPEDQKNAPPPAYREKPAPQSHNPRSPSYQRDAQPAPNTTNPRAPGYQKPTRTLDAGDDFIVKVK